MGDGSPRHTPVAGGDRGMTDPVDGKAADALTIARLAALSQIEYDRVRVDEAEAMGCRVSTLDGEVERARAANGEIGVEPDRRPPEFSDESLALRFTAQHQHRLRYVADWGRWLIYDGKVWAADTTLQVFDHARAICRAASSECNDPTVAAIIASARTVAAVERLAKADRRHAATIEQWDQDPWLLNTPGGVIDLRTGDLSEHRADDHMTKITTATPVGDCPLWLAFLDKVTGKDVDLQCFLQRMAGYSLTGLTREHALFFPYGTGGNGKGVFLNTLTGAMGNYATVASMETFTASAHERHPADLAMLRGARLVTAQETEEGRRWAEARIKALTGGDPITARFMRQDFFTFIPVFKLIIAGNHKPGLRSVDEAIRRRFHLIPFSVRIGKDERDEKLPEKLRAEWPGILKWALDGCLAWQKGGIAPPNAVVDATETYLKGEDTMGLWRAECCVLDDREHTLSSELYDSWKSWKERRGEAPGSQKRFSQEMEKEFAPKRKTGGRAGFLCIRLKTADERAREEKADKAAEGE